MKIIIGADIVPTESNEEFFSAGNTEKLIGKELISLLQSADFRVFNLEVPLTDKETPIKKNGPTLLASTKTVAGIKKIGADLLTLANNHIMDQGKQGLDSTIDVLNKNAISYVGAGECLSKLKHSYVIKNRNYKVGIYACAEHEFSIAEENKAGANPFDPLESLDHINSLKKECDYVIVLYHGGKEHYRYPSPLLQKVCRKMVEKGANIVITQHSHCIGCEEKYRDGVIIYGQGNFLFDRSKSEYWQTSLLIQLKLNKHGINVEYIPLRKTDNAVRKADKDDGKSILKEFNERSEEIKNDKFIKQYYHKFAVEMQQVYINSLYGIGLIFRMMNKLCGHKLEKKVFERKKLLLKNCIECEAHRELLLEGMKDSY